MERLYHFQTVILLTVMLMFLSCSLTGCTVVDVSQTDNRQVLLDVPPELLEPISPLLVIEKPVEEKISNIQNSKGLVK